MSKPFEMSDFYKYSTKYRKGQTSSSPSTDPNNPQQKGVYKPLQPQECQPLLNSPTYVNSFTLLPYIYFLNTKNNLKILLIFREMTGPKMNAEHSPDGQFLNDVPSELLTWYHDKNHSETLC